MFGRKKLKAEIAILKNFIKSDKKDADIIYRQKDAESALFQSECNKKNELIRELRKQIRGQTEADLFLVSVQICLKLLRGEKKESLSSFYEQQQRLQQWMAATQSPSSQPCRLGFAGLGALVGNIT